MEILYKINQQITTEEFKNLLIASSLGERRPIDDEQCLTGMVNNTNLCVSAWHGPKLVGIARSLTDFHYACYLSDLAVDKAYQNKGIGKVLQVKTQKELGPKCKLILVAAPQANSYYEKIGFTNNSRCWVLDRHETIS